ncbi:MAG: plastocyanin/azurin family copper-binding protein [Gemmatimonadaceae bacterium]
MDIRLRSVARTALVSCALLLACSDVLELELGNPVITLAPSSGDDQVGEAGQPLADSLAVIVQRASDGAPLSGVTVFWEVMVGGGSVSPEQSVTDAAGVARALRTLGPSAGVYGTLAGVDVVEIVFHSTARVQGAFRIASRATAVLTDTTLGTNAEPLVVFVSDENDAPVAGVNVQWSVSGGGGGSVSAASVPTNAAGESQVQYTYGPTAGAHGAQATVSGLIGSPVAFTLTGTAGNATTLTKNSDDGTAAPGTQVVHTVVTRDARGNARGGVTIQWAVATGGGSITPAENVTGATGTAAATRTLGASSGAQTATATAPALPGAPQVTFTTTAAAIVQVSNNMFTPSSISIATGASVTWEWQPGASGHNVTFGATAGAPAHIGDRSSGSESRTFDAAGTFGYQCTIHLGMSGSVTVAP